MPLLRTITSGIRSLFQKRAGRELDEELRGFMEMAAEESMKQGRSQKDALRAVRLERGSVDAAKELVRSAGWESLLETSWRDLCYGLRMLRKSPGFTIAVVLTLALGIGANTAIFTLVYSTLLRSLPFPQADRIVVIHDTRIGGRSTGGLMTGPRFFDIEARSRSFQSLAFYYFEENTLIVGRKLPIAVKVAGANAGFWDVLGAAPMLGRTFNAADDMPRGPQKVVLSYAAWQRMFDGDLSVIGKQVTLDQSAATVIGVMPRDFSPPGRVDLLQPAQLMSSSWGSYRGEGLRFLNVFGRLRTGVTLQQERSDLSRIAEQLQREYPQSDSLWRFTSETLREYRYGDLRPALLVLLMASALLLLMACINVANLLLSRASVRRREVALRRAMGASPRRLALQFLVEGALLAMVGGCAGIVSAFALSRTVASSLPGVLGRPGALHMDWIVIGVALLISLGTGIIFGVVPLLDIRKVQLQAAMKQGDVRVAGSSSNWLRSVLVGAQVALSLMLLVGASLLGKSLWNLMKQPLGFDPEHIVSFSVGLPWDTKPEQARNFYEDVQRRIEHLAGVLAAGQIDAPPTVDWHSRSNFDADWLPQTVGPTINAENRSIAGNLFTTMGTPLLAGRAFTAADERLKVAPVLVNQTLVREFMPNGNLIGHHLLTSGEPHEIVGVVADVRGASGSIAAEPGPVVYWPANAYGSTHRYFLVRTKILPEQLVEAIRQQVYEVDSRQSIGNIATMDQLLGEAVAEPRLNATVVASFASIALLLACVGIYGVVSYIVKQRTHEIGVRMALGAQRRDVLRMIIGRGLSLTLAGAGAGIGGALALTRFLSSLLYGVKPIDPLALITVSVILTAVALAACYIPARRATRVDPMVALRHE
jgi:predicted permease